MMLYYDYINNKPMWKLQNLEGNEGDVYYNTFWQLQNLQTDIGEYSAKAGSTSIFDYSNGDPFSVNKALDMHKEAGAKLHFNGATGNQQATVMGQFLQGADRRIDDGAQGDVTAKYQNINNHYDTSLDMEKAFEAQMQDQMRAMSAMPTVPSFLII